MVQTPVVVVLVAGIRFQTDNPCIAGKGKGTAMNTHSYQGVAIRLLQLLDDIGCRGAVRTPLPGEVLQEHDALCRFGLLVYQALVFRYVVTAGQQEANAA